MMFWITMWQCSKRNLNEHGTERSYTIWGKENLTGAAGISPVAALWYNGALKEKEET